VTKAILKIFSSPLRGKSLKIILDLNKPGRGVRLRRIAHRETRPPRLSESDGGQAAMGKNTATFGETITAYWHLDYLYAPASMLCVCRRLPANE